MAKIKEVTVNTIIYNPICRYYAWTRKVFKTFTDDNGNKTYYINDKQVTKEEGNASYKAIKTENANYQKTCDCKDYIKNQWKSYYWAKKSGHNTKLYTLHEADTFKQEVKEYEISYEKMIEQLENSIDKYTEYIDDPGQYRAAEKANQEIRDKIRALENLIKERK